MLVLPAMAVTKGTFMYGCKALQCCCQLCNASTLSAWTMMPRDRRRCHHQLMVRLFGTGGRQEAGRTGWPEERPRWGAETVTDSAAKAYGPSQVTQPPWLGSCSIGLSITLSWIWVKSYLGQEQSKNEQRPQVEWKEKLDPIRCSNTKWSWAISLEQHQWGSKLVRFAGCFGVKRANSLRCV